MKSFLFLFICFGVALSARADLGRRGEEPENLEDCFTLKMPVGLNLPSTVCIAPLVNPGQTAVAVGDSFTVSVYGLHAPIGGYYLVDRFHATATYSAHDILGPRYLMEGTGEGYRIYLTLFQGSDLPDPQGVLTRLEDGARQDLSRYYSDPSEPPSDPWHCHPGRPCH